MGIFLRPRQEADFDSPEGVADGDDLPGQGPCRTTRGDQGVKVFELLLHVGDSLPAGLVRIDRSWADIVG